MLNATTKLDPSPDPDLADAPGRRAARPPRCLLRQKVFLSYHHQWDIGRAELIRSMAPDRIRAPVSDPEWHRLVHEGDGALAQWINQGIAEAACTVVLITPSTRGRRLIEHEILTSWQQRRGLFGLYVHNLPDAQGHRCHRGPNPLSEFRMSRDNQRLSDIVPVHEAPYGETGANLRYIADMLPEWVQEATAIRRNYSA